MFGCGWRREAVKWEGEVSGRLRRRRRRERARHGSSHIDGGIVGCASFDMVQYRRMLSHDGQVESCMKNKVR